MTRRSVPRIISLTGAAAQAPDEQFSTIDRLNRQLLQRVAGQILDDGERHIAQLMDSELDWTILRSPVMNDYGSSDYELVQTPPAPWRTINRDGVVAALLDLTSNINYQHQAPFITR